MVSVRDDLGAIGKDNPVAGPAMHHTGREGDAARPAVLVEDMITGFEFPDPLPSGWRRYGCVDRQRLSHLTGGLDHHRFHRRIRDRVHDAALVLGTGRGPPAGLGRGLGAKLPARVRPLAHRQVRRRRRRLQRRLRHRPQRRVTLQRQT